MIRTQIADTVPKSSSVIVRLNCSVRCSVRSLLFLNDSSRAPCLAIENVHLKILPAYSIKNQYHEFVVTEVYTLTPTHSAHHFLHGHFSSFARTSKRSQLASDYLLVQRVRRCILGLDLRSLFWDLTLLQRRIDSLHEQPVWHAIDNIRHFHIEGVDFIRNVFIQWQSILPINRRSVRTSSRTRAR